MGTGDQEARVGEERNRPSAPQPRPSTGGLSTRGAVAVGVGIILILVLALLVIHLVAKTREIQAVLQEYSNRNETPEYGWGGDKGGAQAAIASLGGREKALRRLRFYLRLPEGICRYRGVAAYLLAHCGQPAVPALVRSLRDGSPDARRSAAEGLGELGPEATEAISALVATLNDDHVTVCEAASFALVRIGPKAVPALVEAVKNGDAWTRRFSVLVLGEMGPSAKAAIPAIAGALKDGEQSVRKAAAEALKKIHSEAPESPGEPIP